MVKVLASRTVAALVLVERRCFDRYKNICIEVSEFARRVLVFSQPGVYIEFMRTWK